MKLADAALPIEFDFVERARKLNFRVEDAVNLGIATGNERHPIIEERPLSPQYRIKRTFEIRSRRPLTLKLNQAGTGKRKVRSNGTSLQAKGEHAALTVKIHARIHFD